MFDLLKLFEGQACEHTQTPIQRRQAPNPQLKIGMPGVGPAITISSKQSGQGYQYYCPTCQKVLPAAENARWERLYASQQGTSRPQPKRAPTRKSSPAGTKSRKSSSGGYQREPIGAKLRYDILTRDRYRCVKCGSTKEQSRLHVDHIIPVSQGGTNDPKNLQTLCEKCNLGKGARRG
ncbi:MAG TPA: HNH endonuclease [Chloroflexia bacterium]|nr:HNH endonuclease [Chloroflexia bacterium]